MKDFPHLPANGVRELSFQLSAPRSLHIEGLGDLSDNLWKKLSLVRLVHLLIHST